MYISTIVQSPHAHVHIPYIHGPHARANHTQPSHDCCVSTTKNPEQCPKTLSCFGVWSGHETRESGEGEGGGDREARRGRRGWEVGEGERGRRGEVEGAAWDTNQHSSHPTNICTFMHIFLASPILLSI